MQDQRKWIVDQRNLLVGRKRCTGWENVKGVFVSPFEEIWTFVRKIYNIVKGVFEFYICLGA